MSVVAIVILVAGAIVAVIGAAVTTRTSGRATSETDQGTRTDLAVAVGVFGVVTMLFGAACLGFVLMTQA